MEQVLYKLPDGWEWMQLGEALDVRDGTHDSPKYVESGFPLVTSKNITGKGLDVQNVKYISKEDFDAINKRSKVDVGDILFAMIGTIGFPTVITDEPNYAIKNVALFKKRQDDQNMDFFKYFLESPYAIESMLAQAKGAAQKFVGLKVLRSFNVPLPPKVEQKRIVEKLDALLTRIDTAIEHLQESVTLADALYASTINEQMMQAIELAGLSTVEKHIEQIQTGTTPPTKQPEFYENGDINWFAPSDFGDHDILFDSNKKLSQKAFDAGKARKFDAGTIMLVAIGATIAKIGYLEQNASSNQQITGMKFNSDIIPRYAYYWFRFIKPEILTNASTATLPIINQKGIKALSFCAPNKQLQETICRKIDEVSNFRNKVKAELNEKVELMRSLKASILDSAFKGEL